MRFVLFIFLLISGVSKAQTTTIKLTDKNSNTPLIGATLQSNNGNSISDVNGVFTLIIQKFPDTLIIKYLGYETKNIFISNLIKIQMVT